MPNRPGSFVSQLVNTLNSVGRLLPQKVRHMPRNVKQGCLLSLDTFYMIAAIVGAVGLRRGQLYLAFGPLEYTCMVITVAASAFIFLRLGLYRAVIRFMGQQAIWAIITGVSYSALVLGATFFFTRAEVPRSTPFIYWGLLLLFVGGTRLVVRAYYQARMRRNSENVIIYGAGQSGRQLLHTLQHGGEYNPVLFVDDDRHLQRSVINGLRVACPESLEELIERHDITQVLLAVPSASADRRREIIDSLVGFQVHVRTVPTISELLAGEASVNQIRDIDLDDLLGREPVPPHPELIERCITGKVVLVTGAGGSIGAELCRQLVQYAPHELVLLDNSEYALYQIERELREMIQGSSIELVALLGSVQDYKRLESICSTFCVATVYHAAAYKHVPMVEYNIAEGVANNVFGTWYAAEAARKTGVETFVLVSTDKAVRPTNVMGASKRFAEMVLQGLAQEPSGTRFCMVRFGNVLGSSGSVVPLFRQQIEAGGPVTVTHAEVSRYFMSIPEAAQLVLQAGAMGTGGDVFVLDMGEPVRIIDLARRMIRLSGYGLGLDNGAPGQGGIDIEIIGLRPGEKLHEELLLGSNVTGTGHPMIMRAEEESLPREQIERMLRELKTYCDALDCEGISAVLGSAVSGFGNHRVHHDYMWCKQGGTVAGDLRAVSNVKELFPDKS